MDPLLLVLFVNWLIVQWELLDDLLLHVEMLRGGGALCLVCSLLPQRQNRIWTDKIELQQAYSIFVSTDIYLFAGLKISQGSLSFSRLLTCQDIIS